MLAGAKEPHDVSGYLVPYGQDVFRHNTSAHDVGTLMMQADFAGDAQPLLVAIGCLLSGDGTVGPLRQDYQLGAKRAGRARKPGKLAAPVVSARPCVRAPCGCDLAPVGKPLIGDGAYSARDVDRSAAVPDDAQKRLEVLATFEIQRLDGAGGRIDLTELVSLVSTKVIERRAFRCNAAACCKLVCRFGSVCWCDVELRKSVREGFECRLTSDCVVACHNCSPSCA